MLTYSRSKGLFAGIDLGGSWVQRDKDSTRAMYGKDSATQIFNGKIPTPSAARPFVAEVRGSSSPMGMLMSPASPLCAGSLEDIQKRASPGRLGRRRPKSPHGTLMLPR